MVENWSRTYSGVENGKDLKMSKHNIYRYGGHWSFSIFIADSDTETE